MSWKLPVLTLLKGDTKHLGEVCPGSLETHYQYKELIDSSEEYKEYATIGRLILDYYLSITTRVHKNAYLNLIKS